MTIKVNDHVELTSATGPVVATVVGRYAGAKGDVKLILRVPGITGTVVVPESQVTPVGLSLGNDHDHDDFADWTPEQHIDAAAALIEKYPYAGEAVNWTTTRILRAQWHILQAALKRDRAQQSHSSMLNAFRTEHRRLEDRRARERLQELQAQYDRHRLGADDA